MLTPAGRQTNEWREAIEAIDTNHVMCGDFETALSYLNAIHNERLLSCREIHSRYRAHVDAAIEQIRADRSVKIAPEWIYMYMSPLDEQALFIARFLAEKPAPIAKRRPREQDFRAIARFYNGRGYEKHYYHERLERWHREFSEIIH